MSEPIRLWRWDNRLGVIGATTWHDSAPNGVANEYAALTRAEYDALVRERDEAKASAAAAGRLLDEHRNGCVWMTWHKEAEDRANAATARAEKAEALLREARREALTLAAKVCRDRAETSCMTGGACERNDAAAIERLRDGDDDDDDATPDAGFAGLPIEQQNASAPSSDEWRGVDADAIQAATGRARPTTEAGQAAQTPP